MTATVRPTHPNKHTHSPVVSTDDKTELWWQVIAGSAHTFWKPAARNILQKMATSSKRKYAGSKWRSASSSSITMPRRSSAHLRTHTSDEREYPPSLLHHSQTTVPDGVAVGRLADHSEQRVHKRRGLRRRVTRGHLVDRCSEASDVTELTQHNAASETGDANGKNRGGWCSS